MNLATLMVAMTLFTSQCQKLTQGSLTQLSVFLFLFIFSNLFSQCQLCKILKTVNVIGQSANKKRNHRLLLVMLPFRVRLARF